jgi:hypothetical protein
MKRILPTLLLTLSLTTPALAADHGGKTGVRDVCAKSAYVKRSPGFVVIGTLFKEQKIKVTRYDRSGKHAYGYAYGHVRKHGWVVTADLCK